MKALTAGKIARQLHISPYVVREWLNANVEPIDVIKYARGVSLIYPKSTRKRFPEIRIYAADRKRLAAAPVPAKQIATASDVITPTPAANEPDMKTLVVALQVQINELARRVA